MECGKAVVRRVVARAVGRAAARAGFDSGTHTHGIPTVQPEGRRVASAALARAVA